MSSDNWRDKKISDYRIPDGKDELAEVTSRIGLGERIRSDKVVPKVPVFRLIEISLLTICMIGIGWLLLQQKKQQSIYSQSSIGSDSRQTEYLQQIDGKLGKLSEYNDRFLARGKEIERVRAQIKTLYSINNEIQIQQQSLSSILQGNKKELRILDEVISDGIGNSYKVALKKSEDDLKLNRQDKNALENEIKKYEEGVVRLQQEIASLSSYELDDIASLQLHLSETLLFSTRTSPNSPKVNEIKEQKNNSELTQIQLILKANGEKIGAVDGIAGEKTLTSIINLAKTIEVFDAEFNIYLETKNYESILRIFNNKCRNNKKCSFK